MTESMTNHIMHYSSVRHIIRISVQTEMKASLVTLRSRLSLLRNKITVRSQILVHEIESALENKNYEAARIHFRQLATEKSLYAAYGVLALHVDESMQWWTQLYTAQAMHPDWRQPTASLAYAAPRCGDSLPELDAITKELRLLYGDQYVDEASSDATALSSGVNKKLVSLLSPRETLDITNLALQHNILMDDAAAAALVPSEGEVVEITAPLPVRRVVEEPSLLGSIYACFPWRDARSY